MIPTMTNLERVVVACRELIETRFPDKPDSGGAAVLLGDGSILTVRLGSSWSGTGCKDRYRPFRRMV